MNRLIVALAIVLAAAGCGPAAPLAPDFAVRRLNESKKLTRQSFLGKVVVLEFWATWCGPCREVMPHLQELHEKYRDKGLEVIALSNEEEPVIRRFVQNSGFTFPFYVDVLGATTTAYGVGSIPHAVVIDREGGVAFNGHPGSPEMDEAIERAL